MRFSMLRSASEGNSVRQLLSSVKDWRLPRMFSNTEPFIEQIWKKQLSTRYVLDQQEAVDCTWLQERLMSMRLERFWKTGISRSCIRLQRRLRTLRARIPARAAVGTCKLTHSHSVAPDLFSDKSTFVLFSFSLMNSFMKKTIENNDTR